MADSLLINRAPVLALWATVVAERLGYSRDEALSLGKAVTGLTAQNKGRRLGIYGQKEKGAGEKEKGLAAAETVELMGRSIPTAMTDEGIRAVADGRPVSTESAQRYLESKFGGRLAAVRSAFEELAGSVGREQLAVRAFGLYERFRPAIPEDVRGWGAKGVLDLDVVRGLAEDAKGE
jgi:hypothetical protein